MMKIATFFRDLLVLSVCLTGLVLAYGLAALLIGYIGWTVAQMPPTLMLIMMFYTILVIWTGRD